MLSFKDSVFIDEIEDSSFSNPQGQKVDYFKVFYRSSGGGRQLLAFVTNKDVIHKKLGVGDIGELGDYNSSSKAIDVNFSLKPVRNFDGQYKIYIS